jgi:dihydrofolate reductase
MELSLIVAVSQNGVIGRAGGLPWHLSADLRRFKRITLGHTLIMGRKTYESIGRALPGRTSIVISSQRGYQAPGCEVAADWPTAVRLATPDSQAFVIGGRQIYQLALPQVQCMYWTQVLAEVEGEVRFPAVDWSEWQLVSEEFQPADDRNDHACRFCVYKRRTVSGP